MSIIADIKQYLFIYAYKIREFFGNHYSYELEGFSFKSGKTSIIYKIRGKHHTYKRPIDSAYLDHLFLRSFDPLDVKKICEHHLSPQNTNFAPIPKEKFFLERKIANKSQFLPFLSMLYIIFLVLAILLSPNLIEMGSLTEPGGILLFPLTYNIADIICEVYGYSAIRKIIWGSIICLFISTLFVSISILLKPALQNTHHLFYSYVFGKMPRLLLANTASIVLSDLANANLFARLKVITHGKYLWLRIIGGSAIGEIVYTLIWIFVFFHGQLPISQLLRLAIQNYLFKVVYNAFLIPITYVIAFNFKKMEGIYSEQ